MNFNELLQEFNYLLDQLIEFLIVHGIIKKLNDELFYYDNRYFIGRFFVDHLENKETKKENYFNSYTTIDKYAIYNEKELRGELFWKLSYQIRNSMEKIDEEVSKKLNGENNVN